MLLTAGASDMPFKTEFVQKWQKWCKKSAKALHRISPKINSTQNSKVPNLYRQW